MSNCLVCRRTGICDQLPPKSDMPVRLAFAEKDHKCCEPHAPARPIKKVKDEEAYISRQVRE